MTKYFKVNYVRDGLTEEFHTGVFVDSKTDETTEPYYLRSCAKPLQASLLIDYGIDFTPEEIALCSGSHSGEECHIKIANQIMDKIGVKESDLKCGVHPPLSKNMQNKMLLRGEQPSQIHNNCSGKHLGFLAICKKNGWDIKTYDEPNHPLQIEVKKKIYDLCQVKQEYPMTTDGCGVPIVSMPLNNLVTGFKNLCEKYPRIMNSIMQNPYIYGGEDRLDTEIIQTSDKLIAKVGAGGLCVVYNTAEKTGFAVKINDASMPARKVFVSDLIRKLNWGNLPCEKDIKTISGKIVGKIEVIYL